MAVHELSDGLVSQAHAKINLTLRVLGRRADGYHELSSLVLFAGSGDVLRCTPDLPFSLETIGPFAGAIEGGNLVDKAVALALAHEPRLRSGAFVLEKNLPVASGIGGGSADAAAALRILQHLNRDLASAIDWHVIARSVGA